MDNSLSIIVNATQYFICVFNAALVRWLALFPFLYFVPLFCHLFPNTSLQIPSYFDNVRKINLCVQYCARTEADFVDLAHFTYAHKTKGNIYKYFGSGCFRNLRRELGNRIDDDFISNKYGIYNV